MHIQRRICDVQKTIQDIKFLKFSTIKQHAEQFSLAKFKKEISEFIEREYGKFKEGEGK